MKRAIETIWPYPHGDRFRSRLEARWAVFFNTASVQYEYEPEGFNLNSCRYLPDFFLPDLQCWIEIKPNQKKSHKLERIMDDFRNDIGPIILFKGLPSAKWNGLLFCWDLSDSSSGTSEWSAGFAFCHKCNRTVVSISDDVPSYLRGDRILIGPGPNWAEFGLCSSYSTHRKHHAIGELLDCVAAARQARFEHGESPIFKDNGNAQMA